MLPSLVSPKYRRLWKRRLRRRPLLPFLLAVHAVVDLAITQIDLFGNDPVRFLLTGIVIGQISLLGVWAVSRRRGLPGRVLVAVAAAAAITVALAMGSDDAREFAAFNSAVLAISLFLFGVAEAIRFRLRTGLSRRSRLRFSIWGLLIATTITPLLLFTAKSANWSIFDTGNTLIFLIPEVVGALCVYLLSRAIASCRLLIGTSAGLGVLLAAVLLYLRVDPSTAAYYFGVLTCIGGTLTVLKVGPADRRHVMRPNKTCEATTGERAVAFDEPSSPDREETESIDLRG